MILFLSFLLQVFDVFLPELRDSFQHSLLVVPKHAVLDKGPADRAQDSPRLSGNGEGGFTAETEDGSACDSDEDVALG